MCQRKVPIKQSVIVIKILLEKLFHIYLFLCYNKYEIKNLFSRQCSSLPCNYLRVERNV